MERIGAAAVLTPDGLVGPAVVVVDDGRIVSVGSPLPGEAVPDRLLGPGFVDLQINGCGQDDVAGATTAAAWQRLDAAVLAQGTTSWCPTLITAPLDAYEAPLGMIAAAASGSVGTLKATIAGAHLEGPFLGGAPGAHPDEWIRPPDLAWIADLPSVVKVMTLGPEQPGALDAIRLLVDRGVLVSLGHSTCTYEEALAGAAAGARLVTHLYNAMPALHHRTPGLVGAALSSPDLTPSLIADLVHVHPAALGVAVRSCGRGGFVLVTDAVAWEAERVGSRVRIEMRDGAPRLADGTLAGSALTMDAALRNLVNIAGVGLVTAWIAASATPAHLAGLWDRGVIAPGMRADLVALTAPPELAVEQVWAGGIPVRA